MPPAVCVLRDRFRVILARWYALVWLYFVSGHFFFYSFLLTLSIVINALNLIVCVSELDVYIDPYSHVVFFIKNFRFSVWC